MKDRQRAVGKKREIRFDGGNAGVMRRTKGAECILGKASAGPAVLVGSAARCSGGSAWSACPSSRSR